MTNGAGRVTGQHARAEHLLNTTTPSPGRSQLCHGTKIWQARLSTTHDDGAQTTLKLRGALSFAKKRMTGMTLGAGFLGFLGLAIVLLTGTLASASAGTLVGVGQGLVLVSPCTPEVQVAFEAMELGETWTFSMQVVWPSVPEVCIPAKAALFRGGWNPSTGGCLGGLDQPDRQLCVGPIPAATLVQASWAVCPGDQACDANHEIMSGTANFARA